MVEPEDLKRIREEIDATYAAGHSPTAAQLRCEYTALANRNKSLVLGFSRKVRLLLVLLFVVSLGLGITAVKLTVNIQNSRTDQCNLDNNRHINTEVELEKAIEELHGQLHREAIERQKSTERLLNAVAPLRDCSKL